MTDYSNALNGQPRPLETLRARVSKVKHTDKQVLAWVQSVADATEQHAQHLERILAKYSIDEQDLGTLGSSWDAVASVILANAQGEANAARKLRSEVLEPLKHLFRTYDQSTSAVVADATYSPSAATEVQEADLARATGLRDALVRMQTLFVDNAQETQHAAEKSSSTLLNFNPPDEPESFVAQIVSGVAPTEPPTNNRGNANGTGLRATSSQTFIHNKGAVRKPSRMSMAESHSSEKKRSGLRAKVGSIFRKPKNNSDKYTPLDPPSESRERQSERLSEPPVSERGYRERSETSDSNGINRSSSVRKPVQQPTATQPPDFGLKPNKLSSAGEDEPLSNIRHQRDASTSSGPPVQPRHVSPPQPSNDSYGVLLPTQRNQAAPMAVTAPGSSTMAAPGSNGEMASSPGAPTQSSPELYGAPSVPPPRGGRKINSIYFSGVSAAPRESVIEIPEDRAVDTPVNMSTTSITSSLGRSGSMRRSSIKRDFTGQQSQQHPPLPLVENGPAASILESITALERNGTIETVNITGDLRFTSFAPLELKIINERHLGSFNPAACLSKSESGVYSYDPTTHLAGSTLATYSGSFPPLLPLNITPQWQVTENQTRLIIYYQVSKQYPLETLTLTNLSIAVTVTGGFAKSAHSKPLATFSRERQRVTWRFNGPVELRKGEPERLVCQFVTNAPAYESPEGVEARFEIQNAPTAIGLETRQDGAWVPVSTAATAYTQRHVALSQ